MSISNNSLYTKIADLYSKPTKTLEALNKKNITTINDLLWLLPRRIVKLPDLAKFQYANIGDFFRGRGEVVSIQARPNFKARGKGRAVLLNITVTVKDDLSENFITLKWFNAYQSIQKKIESLKHFEFLGVVSVFNESLQIVNPEIFDIGKSDSETGLRITYPTIDSIKSHHIQKVFDKIPKGFWDKIPEIIPSSIRDKKGLLSRSQAFKYLHGRVPPNEWSQEEFDRAKRSIIYEEFIYDQLKIKLRKNKRDQLSREYIDISKEDIEKARSLYPYQFTEDQTKALNDIIVDFKNSTPSMRLIQGDVGCGKTTVAVASAFLILKSGGQVALMCPTETLALQHFREIEEILGSEFNVELLVGSTKASKKKIINQKLADGDIDIVIGTHSLFQDSVSFANLELAIIDEQHKFGVEQRIKLMKKGENPHCIIMSATPIPRSLSLTKYGDLDISIIKTMPKGRKGQKTRIVTNENLKNYLSFVKTRLEMKEQVYVVVPAIEESENEDIRNLEHTFELYKKYFPDFRITPLHGRMSPDEKEEAITKFKKHEIDILIATSVIEVGINIINSTIMAILSPERFGLSSLHQMRGRVGRGDKPGFCFLVTDREVSPESMQRLQVIEKYTDGFKIAEEDLKIRGEGDLFGQEQSGVVTQKKLANIVLNQDILYEAIEDIKKYPDEFNGVLNSIEVDEKVFTTI
ncbi:ATP-dependent DNA helicase RecG [Halobacteriovorax sp. BALOs_7]|uniref:ATP-dependent DNA helicase RecG n=1 Tax=Halobacteriovorax sp. BALOs_7 TaxID=2109558 RepID=UPI0013C4A923|nr:ATP-dependent DNA helicase RecG [Halobacteriovorax sp. BALOs_7]